MNQRLILASKKNPSPRLHTSRARKVLEVVVRAITSLATRFNSYPDQVLDLGPLYERLKPAGGYSEKDLELINFGKAEGDVRLSTIKAPFTTGHYRPISSYYRMIWDTTDKDQKTEQQRWAKRIGGVPAHKNAWGFCKGRNCINACQSHLTYWNISHPGQLSFFSLDIENFFPSITGDMVSEAMDAHGFSQGDIRDCLLASTFAVTEEFATLIQQIFQRVYGCIDSHWAAFDRVYPSLIRLTNGLYYSPKETTTTLSLPVLGTVTLSEVEPLRKEVVDFARELLFRYILGFNRGCKFGTRILIQGSPASPAISNLVGKRMDFRLAAFAKATGLFYSRYADDVVMSWKGRRTAKNIHLLIHSVSKIIQDCGFNVRSDKTIIKGPGMQQSMLGYNLNSGRPTIPRERRDRVRDYLNKAVTDRNVDLLDFASVMGEVEYIGTAHPEIASCLRELGKRVVGNLSKEVKCKAIDIGQHDEIGFVGVTPRKIALW